MWVFTTGGFTSAVEHRDDETMTMVRGRDKKSLEEMLSSMKAALVEGGKTDEEIEVFMKDMNIYAVPGDYKWRVVVPKSAYALYLVYEAMHYVNYSNFKSKLTATRGDQWHDAAMNVWNAMFKITDTQKTGNDEVDNPKPYTYYHGSYDSPTGSGYNYPAKKDGSVSKLNTPLSKANRTVGSELWDDVDDRDSEELSSGSMAMDYYSADYSSVPYGRDTTSDGVGYDWDSHRDGGAQQRYWGEDLGIKPLFEEDLEGWDGSAEIPSGTGGYHSFSGKPLNRMGWGAAERSDRSDRIDGRAEVRDGKFVGSTFLESELSTVPDGPSDRELELLEIEEAEAWQPWDEETEFNYVTGETRSTIDGAHDRPRKSVMAMTDNEYMAYENEM